MSSATTPETVFPPVPRDNEATSRVRAGQPPIPPPSERPIGYRRRPSKRVGVARGTAVVALYSQSTTDDVLAYFNKPRKGSLKSSAEAVEIGSVFGTGMTTVVVIRWDHGPVKNEYDGHPDFNHDLHKAIFSGPTPAGNLGGKFGRRYDIVRIEIAWEPLTK